jgi:hypothetical protein
MENGGYTYVAQQAAPVLNLQKHYPKSGVFTASPGSALLNDSPSRATFRIA